jgi:hypothetical protein
MSTGWRGGYSSIIDAIQSWLADAGHAGSMSAADFSKLATVPAADGLLFAAFSPLINLASAPAVYPAIVPAAAAGKIYIPNRIVFVVVSKTGTLSTAPVMKMGNDASNANIIAAASQFPNATAINLGAGGAQQAVPSTVIAYTQNATNLEITTAATGTGGFTLTGYYEITGCWAPFV